MKYIIIIDPGVASEFPKGSYPPYDEGIKQDIFIKNSSDLPSVGIVSTFKANKARNFVFC